MTVHVCRAAFLVPALLALTCTPVPPAAAPAQEAPGSEASAASPGPAPPPASATEPAPRVQFARDIQPILESGCRPCHFAGGKMYERLPFDRPETIRFLGEKLFTRIKEEKQQTLIREFLAQEPGR